MAEESILLESGTNEVEVLEFILGEQPFGVNVLKVQAIEQFDPARVTSIQLAHPSVIGTLLFRDSCITLVDLGRELGLAGEGQQDGAKADATAPTTPDAGHLVLIMEFNDLKTAFLVNGVNRIHRTSWDSISPMSPFLSSADSRFTGSLQIEDREILIVDMEKIVADILSGNDIPFTTDSGGNGASVRPERAAVKVFLAEDSAVIRARVESELISGNYIQLESFPNGQACYEALVALKAEAVAADRPVSDLLGAIVSDIEMPRMDGLTLCRNLKEGLQIGDIPVIIFSSLINDQIIQKCDDVGADAHISKPQFRKLIELLDEHCLEKVPVGA